MGYMSREEIKGLLVSLGLEQINSPKEVIGYPFVFVLPTVARKIGKNSKHQIPSSMVRVESPVKIISSIGDFLEISHYAPYAYYGLQARQEGIRPIFLGGPTKREPRTHPADLSMCLRADIERLNELFEIEELYQLQH